VFLTLFSQVRALAALPWGPETGSVVTEWSQKMWIT